MRRNIPLSLLLLLTGSIVSFAQNEPGKKVKGTPPAPPVTISITAAGVRFAAPTGGGQMRLEVFDAAGQPLYDSGFQPGSVRDWAVQDKQGQALADGAYQCVVTLRDIAGRLSLRQGGVAVQSGRAALQLSDGGGATPLEEDNTLAPVADDAATAATLTAHDGQNGRLIATRGALTFRTGDFFRGLDREQMRLTADGNLGIGTKKPQAMLDVAGDIRAAGLLHVKGIEFADGTVQTGTGSAARTDAAGNIVPLAAGAGTQNRVAKWLDGAGNLGDSALADVNGRIGLGTVNPVSLLHLAGASGVAAITFDTPGNQRFRFQTIPGVQNWGALTLNADYTFPNGWLLDDPTANGYFFKLDTRGGNGSSSNNGLWLFRLPQGAGFHTDETPIFGVTNGRAYFADSVGIGTQSPTAKLEVAGSLKLTGAGSGIQFPDGTLQTSASTGGGGSGGVAGTGTVGTIPLWATTTGLGNSVLSQGSGVINVAGDLTASGTISGGNVIAKYQDVAEWVPARGQLPAGTVVVLDLQRHNTVAASARAYDTHVAGVVSPQPGVILGQGGADKALVATTGRVKVKVDATRAPIRIGDLLVTSNRAGVAMKSVPVRVARGTRLHRPGTIIGKALEPLKSGTGEILVLLSLQ